MQDIRKLARIQIISILLFIICKKWIRPFVLEGDYPSWLDITVLSLPNFFEGIIGVITLTYIGLYVNYRWIPEKGKSSNNQIYFIALVIASIYVLTQEFKLHNLGGNNVYDPWDVLFSLIGLTIAYGIVLKLKPTISSNA